MGLVRTRIESRGRGGRVKLAEPAFEPRWVFLAAEDRSFIDVVYGDVDHPLDANHRDRPMFVPPGHPAVATTRRLREVNGGSR